MKTNPNKLTVLLVDPDWDDTDQIKQLLQQINEYRTSIHHVRNHENALKSIGQTTPDLILIDHAVDEQNGLELAREIRENHFELPLVALVDGGSETLCAEYFRMGVDDYRAKANLDSEELHSAIKYALSQRAKLVKQKQAAQQDELTNLYNRSYTFKRIHEEMKSAVRHDQSFSLCFIDLDGFKEINDNHGHLAGDVLLQEVSEILHDSFRAEDVIGRYGGDEFLVGLRNTDSSGAFSAAEKFIRHLEDTVFHLSANQKTFVTCSAGVAEFDGEAYDYDADIESVDAFFERVDQALYTAKNKKPGTVERRRDYRYSTDETVQVTLEHGDEQTQAQVTNFSHYGIRLDRAPTLPVGEQVTVTFPKENASQVKEEGVIRSCLQRDNDSRASLGVEMDVPIEVIQRGNGETDQ